MATVEEALEMLRARAEPGSVEGMARYGMTLDGRLGVRVPEMRKIAKKLGRDHRLALGLWETEVPEARILASMVDDPRRLTDQQMDDWAAGFDSWDVCDQVCMNLFDKSPLAWRKVAEWSEREEEFVKRAAFALIACLAWHDKTATDERFIELLPIIRREATDERNYVKKAASWALRHIGKRNRALNAAAIAEAREIGRIDSRAARWIASDAIRELEGEAVQRRLG